jgi:hypothetical protein
MMNDRFSAQLRQHLLETADERPAHGHVAAIVQHIAVTSQRRPLIARLPGFPVRIGPFPPMVRYGLLAVALVLAAVAGAILAGGGGPSPSRGTVFEGRWTATDPTDESTLTLIVGEGMAPVVQFQDDFSTGSGCGADEVKIFRADGVGEINGNRLRASYPDGGGCGLMLVAIAGLYDYDADTDTLLDPDGVTWTRVATGSNPPPLRPAPSPNPGQTVTAACIDLTNGGTYTAYTGAGSISLTATVPSTPAIPWKGLRDEFKLSGSCETIVPLAFFASTATSVYETSCMPGGDDFTTFAEAIARLDTPAGDDISERIDLTIDGHAAARYDISNLTTCPEGFGLWHGTALGPRETGSIYVIDVDGVLLEIELNRDGTQSPAELEETYAIIASLTITR